MVSQAGHISPFLSRGCVPSSQTQQACKVLPEPVCPHPSHDAMAGNSHGSTSPAPARFSELLFAAPAGNDPSTQPSSDRIHPTSYTGGDGGRKRPSRIKLVRESDLTNKEKKTGSSFFSSTCPSIS